MKAEAVHFFDCASASEKISRFRIPDFISWSASKSTVSIWKKCRNQVW